ncbi:MAG: FmdB family zinc ribbon protein [Planctomycetota bacterium]|jgi:putative FmdB family regulatory protein
MPTYEYICENCAYKFEQFQSIKAKAIRKCPKCGKVSLTRLIGTGAAVIFKGPGFYHTDYRSESYKKAEKKEKSTTEDTKKKETKPKDSKTNQKSKTDSKEKKQISMVGNLWAVQTATLPAANPSFGA